MIIDYETPSADIIALSQSNCLCVSDLEMKIPNTPETEGSWD